MQSTQIKSLFDQFIKYGSKAKSNMDQINRFDSVEETPMTEIGHIQIQMFIKREDPELENKMNFQLFFFT